MWKPSPSRHEDEYGIRSFVFEARRALVREKFLAWLAEGLPAGLLRAKGFFWFAEQAADIGFLSVAGGGVRTEFVGTWAAALLESGVIAVAAVPANARERWVEPHGDRRVELVFIGVGLDEAEGGSVVVSGFELAGAKPWARISRGLGLLSEDCLISSRLPANWEGGGMRDPRSAGDF